MADTNQQEISEPHTNGVMDGLTEEEKYKMRPADIDADMREMERRKRVEMVMNSRLFREELERIIETQMKDGAGPSGLLQQISEMMGPQGARFNANVFRNSNCVVPINDIRGVESMGYAKGEKMLRCKLAAVFRLLDLYGWTQGVGGQITARLNQDQEHFLVNPYGLLYHEVTASSLVKVDMQGGVVEQGTTNFGVHIAGFQLHSTIHAARPDIKCIVHITTPSVTAISSMKCGLLPIGQESIVIGDVSSHHYISGFFEPEEREKITRNLGPVNKVMLLTNRGALCCGETVEEAFFNVYNMVLACETQLKLMPMGLDNLNVITDEARKAIFEASRKPPVPHQSSVLEPSPLAEKLEKRWRIGGTEFEALMRMLDNAGFRTGYIYRHPLVKSEPPRPRNDIEVPPAVSSLGYLLEEEELYKQGLWKGGRKGTDRTRWLNSPNVYQKVEILETGTPDPKKITKWVPDGSPTHNNSTPVKIDGALQFVPKNTNPKEFKQLQQQIKDYRRADKISAGPQSHILEGVTWEEAKKMQDATISGTGEQVVLVGAASKGIIQRGFQHNAMVYKTPYAKNPFDAVTDQELDQYKKDVERKQKDDESQSESEGLSSFNISRATHESSTAKSPIQSPVSVTSETEEESRDEPRVLRIATKQVPAPSQPEVVFSDEQKQQQEPKEPKESPVTVAPPNAQREERKEWVETANATADFLNELRRSEMMSRNSASGEDVPASSSTSISCGSGNDDEAYSSHGCEYDDVTLEVTKAGMLAVPSKAQLATVGAPCNVDDDATNVSRTNDEPPVESVDLVMEKLGDLERVSDECLSKFEMIRRKFDSLRCDDATAKKPKITRTRSVQSLITALERTENTESTFGKSGSVSYRNISAGSVDVVNLADEVPSGIGTEFKAKSMDEPLVAPSMVQTAMKLREGREEYGSLKDVTTASLYCATNIDDAKETEQEVNLAGDGLSNEAADQDDAEAIKEIDSAKSQSSSVTELQNLPEDDSTNVKARDENGNIPEKAYSPEPKPDEETTRTNDEGMAHPLVPNFLNLSYEELNDVEFHENERVRSNTEDCYIDDEYYTKRCTRRDSIDDVINGINPNIQPSKTVVTSIANTETTAKYILDSNDARRYYTICFDAEPNDINDSCCIDENVEEMVQQAVPEQREGSEEDRTLSSTHNDDDDSDIIWLELNQEVESDRGSVPEINEAIDEASEESGGSSVVDDSNNGSDMLELPSSTVEELMMSGDEAFDKDLRNSANGLLAELDDTESYVSAANFVDELLFSISCLNLPKGQLSKDDMRRVVQEKLTALHLVKDLADELVCSLPCFESHRDESLVNEQNKSSELETSNDSVVVVEEVIHHLVSKRSRSKFHGNKSDSLDGVLAKRFKETKNIELQCQQVDDYQSMATDNLTASTPKVKTSPRKNSVHETDTEKMNDAVNVAVSTDTPMEVDNDEIAIESSSSQSKSGSESNSPTTTGMNYMDLARLTESHNLTEQEITTSSGDNDTKSDSSKEKLPDSSYSMTSSHSSEQTATPNMSTTIKLESEDRSNESVSQAPDIRKIDFCIIECIDSGFAESAESAECAEVDDDIVDCLEDKVTVDGEIDPDFDLQLDIGLQIEQIEDLWKQKEEQLEKYCTSERMKALNQEFDKGRPDEDEASFKHFDEVDEYCPSCPDEETDEDVVGNNGRVIEIPNPLLKPNASLRTLPPILEEEVQDTTDLLSSCDCLFGNLFEESAESFQTDEYYSCKDTDACDATFTVSDDSGEDETPDSARSIGDCEVRKSLSTTTVVLDYMMYSYDTREFMQLEREVAKSENPICCDFEKCESLTSLPKFEDTSLGTLASRLNLSDSLDSQ